MGVRDEIALRAGPNGRVFHDWVAIGTLIPDPNLSRSRFGHSHLSTLTLIPFLLKMKIAIAGTASARLVDEAKKFDVLRARAAIETSASDRGAARRAQHPLPPKRSRLGKLRGCVPAPWADRATTPARN